MGLNVSKLQDAAPKYINLKKRTLITNLKRKTINLMLNFTKLNFKNTFKATSI